MNLYMKEQGEAEHGREAAAAAGPRAADEHGGERAAASGPIVESARDQRALDWLVARFGEAAVREAISRIPGKRRPYPSNIAKALGAKLPSDEDLYRATPEYEAEVRAAREKAIAEYRSKLEAEQQLQRR
jgi:hypothetical protein